eukprot:942211-Rhodomonas_salina.2
MNRSISLLSSASTETSVLQINSSDGYQVEVTGSSKCFGALPYSSLFRWGVTVRRQQGRWEVEGSHCSAFETAEHIGYPGTRVGIPTPRNLGMLRTSRTFCVSVGSKTAGDCRPEKKRTLLLRIRSDSSSLEQLKLGEKERFTVQN